MLSNFSFNEPLKLGISKLMYLGKLEKIGLKTNFWYKKAEESVNSENKHFFVGYNKVK